MKLLSKICSFGGFAFSVSRQLTIFAMKNNNNKALWRFDVFYSLPAPDNELGGELRWDDYSEEAYVLLPDHITDEDDALRFFESAAPTPGMFIGGFSRILETHQ